MNNTDLRGFSEACYDQNSIAELTDALLQSEADETDCRNWNISPAQWREAIQRALIQKLKDQSKPNFAKTISKKIIPAIILAVLLGGTAWAQEFSRVSPQTYQKDLDECADVVRQRLEAKFYVYLGTDNILHFFANSEQIYLWNACMDFKGYAHHGPTFKE
jgi:hypothetical protein